MAKKNRFLDLDAETRKRFLDSTRLDIAIGDGRDPDKRVLGVPSSVLFFCSKTLLKAVEEDFKNGSRTLFVPDHIHPRSLRAVIQHMVDLAALRIETETDFEPPSADEVQIVPNIRRARAMDALKMHKEAGRFIAPIEEHLASSRIALILEEVEALWTAIPQSSSVISAMIVHLATRSRRGELLDIKRIREYALKTPDLLQRLTRANKMLNDDPTLLPRSGQQIFKDMKEKEAFESKRAREAHDAKKAESEKKRAEASEKRQTVLKRKRSAADAVVERKQAQRRNSRHQVLENARMLLELRRSSSGEDDDVIRRSVFEDDSESDSDSDSDSDDDDDSKTVTG